MREAGGGGKILTVNSKLLASYRYFKGTHTVQ